MKIPLLDLKAQLTPLRDEMMARITEVVDSTCYIQGHEVAGLEREIALYCGATRGVGVSSGTDALLVSLMALDVGPGDFVVTTPYTFFATMGSIIRLGASPLFVDIDPVTYNLDPERLAAVLDDRKIRERVKAVMPVHLYGQCADMKRIMESANAYGIPVVEDAAQAIGASCPMEEDGGTVWRKAGSMGTCGCFSFFPSKNLGAMGDGGMVVTSDEDLAARLEILRNHGAEPKYYHDVIGGNFRLDALQAAILRVKLAHLDHWHHCRRRNAGRYNQMFEQAGLVAKGLLRLPVALYQQKDGAEGQNYHIYNQYVIRARQRDGLREFLLKNSIGVEIYYPLALHQQKCVKGFECAAQTFPEAEKAAGETLALPIYPELTAEMQQYVVDAIAGFFS